MAACGPLGLTRYSNSHQKLNKFKENYKEFLEGQLRDRREQFTEFLAEKPTIWTKDLADLLDLCLDCFFCHIDNDDNPKELLKSLRPKLAMGDPGCVTENAEKLIGDIKSQGWDAFWLEYHFLNESRDWRKKLSEVLLECDREDLWMEWRQFQLNKELEAELEVVEEELPGLSVDERRSSKNDVEAVKLEAERIRHRMALKKATTMRDLKAVEFRAFMQRTAGNAAAQEEVKAAEEAIKTLLKDFEKEMVSVILC